MSAIAAIGMLAATPSWAEPPRPIDTTHEVHGEGEDAERFGADEIRELRRELRELRESLEAEREAVRRELFDQQRERALQMRADRERVGFGTRVVVPAGDDVTDVVAFGNDVVVDGTVRGDATAFGGSVLITPRGIVHGDAISFGGTVQVEDGGMVFGDRVAVEDPTGTTSASLSIPGSADASQVKSFLSSLYHRLVLLLSFAGAGVLVIGLFPNRVDRIAQGVEERPFWSAVLGTFATVLLTVFAVLFTLLTVGLGSPLSALMLAGLGAAWLFGFVGLCQAIGDRLPFADKPHGRWLTFLVGTVLLSCLGSLPWIGWLVVFAASMISVGAALTSRFGAR